MSQELEAILRRSGTLTSQELALSLGQANARKMSLWDVLVLERPVSEETLAEAFSTWLKMPRVRLDAVDIEVDAVGLVAGWLARKYTCLPLRTMGKNLVLAMANPLDRQAIQDVEFASSRQVQPVVASRTEILIGIEEHYSSGDMRAAETSVVRVAIWLVERLIRSRRSIRLYFRRFSRIRSNTTTVSLIEYPASRSSAATELIEKSS
jgi:hypothetical protein